MKLVRNFLITGVGFLVTVDTIVTILFWELETNQIVLSMGLSSFVFTKIIAVILLYLVWRIFPLEDSIISRLCLVWLFILHLFVTITNLYVVNIHLL